MARSRFFRAVILLLSVAMLAMGIAGQGLAQGRHALVAEVDGMINPVTQRFISRAIERGEEGGAEIVVIKLDTPGGLLDSTRKIVEDLLGADVPTAVYVHPPGAHAASAGTFIAAAANFAVMAPGTNIGAAAPVGAGGEDIPDTLASKVVEDTAALMRTIAETRDRNSEALEATVREAKAYDAQQAVDLDVVDFMADDVGHLLQQIHGAEVSVAYGVRTLDTRDLALKEINMNLIEKFLFFLADPNVSFLLLSLGGLGLVIELFNPGLIVPGVVGAILLLLAFVSLGNLPVNWAAVGFIGLAVGLFVAELLVSGFGILGIGAIVSFIFGGLLLFSSFGTPSPTIAPTSVNLWILGSLSGALSLFGIWFVRTVSQSRREGRQPQPSASTLIGAVGIATADLAPRGTVQVQDEVWTAETEDGIVIKMGERVRVIEAKGLILKVARADEQPP